ncbi:MAG: VCBS repeat-containing protein [Acidobacteria bacterium]|nr:VCBS repeat-containing protein [Acidobacteriota bacterium]
MKRFTLNENKSLRGVSTLDVALKNVRALGLLLAAMLFFGNAVYGGHSTLDLVDPAFNPQIQTNSFRQKEVQQIIRLPNGKNLAFGSFNNYNRQPVSGLVRLNADGTLDQTFNNFLLAPDSQPPSFVVPQPDGRILVGCCFTLNGQTATAPKLIRLTADGQFDASFTADLGLEDLGAPLINSVAADAAGRVLVSGFFRFSVNGTPTTVWMIRLNPDGSRDASFNYTLPYSPNRFALQNDKIVISNESGSPRSVQRLNADGSLDDTFTPTVISDSTRQIFIRPDRKIVVATYSAIIRLAENGGPDPTFQTIALSASLLKADLADDGRITVLISSAQNGSLRERIIRYLPDGPADPSFTPYVNTSSLYFLNCFATQADGSVWLGDYLFNVPPQLLNTFIRLLPTGAPDPTFNPGGTGFQNILPGSISAIAVQPDNKIIIGGLFNEVDGTPRFRLARINPDSTIDPTFNISTSGTSYYFNYISTVTRIILQPDGKLLVAGEFEYVPASGYNRLLVRLNPDGSIDPTFNHTLSLRSQSVLPALQDDGKIVVGRQRDTVYMTENTPVRLNPNGSRDTAFTPNIYSTRGYVTVLGVTIQPDGKILISGVWGEGMGNGSFIVRLNPDGSPDPAFQTNEENGRRISNPTVLPNGKILIVKDALDTASGRYLSTIVRLNPDGSPDPVFNAGTGTDGRIDAILPLANGKIMAGGKFATFNGVPRQNLAQLTADGVPVAVTYDLNDEVLSLAVDGDGRLLVGGIFTVVNANGAGAPRSYLARLIDSATQNARFDFDGDGRSDYGVFRPADGMWRISNSFSARTSDIRFGTGGDIPIPGDFDNDGLADAAVFRPSNGVWYLLRSRDGFGALHWGAAGDIPVSGDYDGDGKADFAVWRPSTAVWYILPSANQQPIIVKFGLPDDIPLPAADFDGDGKTDIAVWRALDGNFYWLASGSNNQFRAVHFGDKDDIPAAADYNGDGRTDLVVYRPLEGNWYEYLSTAGGGYSFAVVRFGLDGDVPVAADYDGDGRTDIAVRRGNQWHILRSTQGYAAFVFGDNTDTPVAALPRP